MQVLSATPQTYFYNQEAALAAACAAHPERPDRQARRRPSRPLHRHRHAADAGARQRAADELVRAVRTLKLRGAMIGSNVEGRNLDDPALRAVVGGGGGARREQAPRASGERGRRRPAALLLSRQSDRQSARHHDRGGCLMFGGVLEQHPRLNVCVARRRLYSVSGRALGARLGGAGGAESQYEAVAGKIDRPFSLRHHFARAGDAGIANRVGRRRADLPGSDYPYDMGTLDACGTFVRSLNITEAERDKILHGHAGKILAQETRDGLDRDPI